MDKIPEENLESELPDLRPQGGEQQRQKKGEQTEGRLVFTKIEKPYPWFQVAACYIAGAIALVQLGNNILVDEVDENEHAQRTNQKPQTHYGYAANKLGNQGADQPEYGIRRT